MGYATAIMRVATALLCVAALLLALECSPVEGACLSGSGRQLYSRRRQPSITHWSAHCFNACP